MGTCVGLGLTSGLASTWAALATLWDCEDGSRRTAETPFAATRTPSDAGFRRTIPLTREMTLLTPWEVAFLLPSVIEVALASDASETWPEMASYLGAVSTREYAGIAGGGVEPAESTRDSCRVFPWWDTDRNVRPEESPEVGGSKPPAPVAGWFSIELRAS